MYASTEEVSNLLQIAGMDVLFSPNVSDTLKLVTLMQSPFCTLFSAKSLHKQTGISPTSSLRRALLKEISSPVLLTRVFCTGEI